MDESFESLLNDLFGSDLMSQFRRKRPAGYIDLMIAFESRKRSCSPKKMSPLNVALPFSFIDFYKKTKGKDASQTLDDSSETHKVRTLTESPFLSDWIGLCQVREPEH